MTHNLTVDRAQPIIERFAPDQWKTVEVASSMHLFEHFFCVMHHNLLQIRLDALRLNCGDVPVIVPLLWMVKHLRYDCSRWCPLVC